MKKSYVLPAAAGLLLFAFILTRIGWIDIARQLKALEMGLPILCAIGLARFALQTIAWSKALGAEGIQVSARELLGIRMAAQSIGYLSVLGPMVSEPMRIKLLQHHQENALAATLADTCVYGFAAGLLGLAGCICALLLLTHGGETVMLVTTGAAIVFGLAAAVLPGSLLRPLVRVLGRRCPGWLIKVERIELSIRRFAVRNRPLIHRMFWLDLGCQVLLLGEVAAVLVALSIPVHALTVLALEAATRAVRALAGWVPARIGADETGAVAAFAALGLPAASGLTLALTRRARDLLGCLLGLGWLVWRSNRPGQKSVAPARPAARAGGVCNFPAWQIWQQGVKTD